MALTILELLAFNAQKCTGQVAWPRPPSEHFFKPVCPDCSQNLRAKFEVCSFDCFGAMSIWRPLHTDVHTDAHNLTKTLSPPFTAFSWWR